MLPRAPGARLPGLSLSPSALLYLSRFPGSSSAASPVAQPLVLAGFEPSVFPPGLISSSHLQIAIQNPPSGLAHRKGGGSANLISGAPPPGGRERASEPRRSALATAGGRGDRATGLGTEGSKPSSAQILPGLGLVAAWDAPRSPGTRRCWLRPPP